MLLHKISDVKEKSENQRVYCDSTCIRCSIKFLLKVERSIVNAPWITDQLFKFNLTFCVVCVK
jgi:hypothetical protein